MNGTWDLKFPGSPPSMWERCQTAWVLMHVCALSDKPDGLLHLAHLPAVVLLQLLQLLLQAAHLYTTHTYSHHSGLIYATLGAKYSVEQWH